MVVDENDRDAYGADGSTVMGAIVDVVSGVVVMCVFGPVKSCVPRLFTKN